MKKLILVAALLAVGMLPASAQYWGPYGTYSSTTAMENLGRRVANSLGINDVPWVRQVRYEERLLKPGGYFQTSFYTFHTRNFQQRRVQDRDKLIVFKRMNLLHKAVANNHTLKNYTFVVPMPTDLAQLTTAQMNYLLGFLAQPAHKDHFNKKYTPLSVTQAEKGVTEVQLAAPDRATLILRIDSFREKVFYFLNEY